ncbi:MAG TPA: cupredoxin domain-containing protein [Acidimicrobiia bacterium]|nr:cupredoxin domain-containing protein [Acidimicrobiia bacterium]
MAPRRQLTSTLALVTFAATVLASMPSAAAAQSARTVRVTLTDAGCPARLTLRAGTTTFEVTNDGADDVSEFEILEGHTVVGEKENLAPGLSGSFDVTLKAGAYTTYCPGGARERGKLVVTGATRSGQAAGAGTTTRVAVTLGEYTIRARPLSVPAGTVRFAVRNTGGLVHEFVVARGSSATLTTAPDGSVAEDQIAKADQLGELEELGHGDTATLTARNLTPGTYVLFCNVVDKSGGTTVSHFANGMHATLTVH